MQVTKWPKLVTDGIGSIDVDSMTSILSAVLSGGTPQEAMPTVGASRLEHLLTLVRKWLHAVCDCKMEDTENLVELLDKIGRAHV